MFDITRMRKKRSDMSPLRVCWLVTDRLSAIHDNNHAYDDDVICARTDMYILGPQSSGGSARFFRLSGVSLCLLH